MRQLCPVFLRVGLLGLAALAVQTEDNMLQAQPLLDQEMMQAPPPSPAPMIPKNIDGWGGGGTFGGSGQSMAPTGYAPIIPGIGGGIMFTPETRIDAPTVPILSLCNRTSEELQVAVRLRENGSWVQRGWLRLATGGCTQFSRQQAGEEMFYLALSPTRTFGGDQMFCITRERGFRLVGSDCPEGHRPEGFRRVELSEDLTTHEIE